MFVNMHHEINLKQGIPTIDTFKEHFEDFTISIHLEAYELVSFFKNYVRTNLDIDLDELEVLVIFDNRSKRIVLDTEYLENNDREELFLLIDEFKYHFGKNIFEIRAALNTQVLLRKLISACESYKFNVDGSIDIEYLLYNINETDLENYMKIEEEF